MDHASRRQVDDEFGATHQIKTGKYEPTRFDYLLAHILPGMLSGQSEKNHEAIVRRAINIAGQAEEHLKRRVPQ